jgi:hypothetical protein
MLVDAQTKSISRHRGKCQK